MHFVCTTSYLLVFENDDASLCLTIHCTWSIRKRIHRALSAVIV